MGTLTQPNDTVNYIAFDGARRIFVGSLPDVAAAVKSVVDDNPWAAILIFDCHTSEQVEIDFRGTAEDVLRRIEWHPVAEVASIHAPEVSVAGPGRPKLGVVAREVTLLPRHWDWLNTQPGGASVALRKLVEEARRVNADKDRIRLAREATYKFMSAMAGDRPGFEEASRALFAGNPEKFDEIVESWPKDVRDHLKTLAIRGWDF
jgi:hypothetical protein